MDDVQEKSLHDVAEHGDFDEHTAVRISNECKSVCYVDLGVTFPSLPRTSARG